MTKQFYEQLDAYKRSVEATIDDFAIPEDELAATVYGQLLQRGGKRIRGSLVINGYEMCGGVHSDLASRAARLRPGARHRERFRRCGERLDRDGGRGNRCQGDP